MEKQRDSLYIYIPVINLIYKKHIHHLMVYMSVWYEILQSVEILGVIILMYYFRYL